MSESATLDAPATIEPAAPTPAATPAASAPTPAAPAAPSLMERGAAASPAPAPEPAPASPIPAKYQVKKEDGSLDIDASMAKWGDGHKHLEQRLGAGEAPPATPEDYQLALPEGVTFDELKADPLFTGFLKGAHAQGLTNKQVSYVIGAYQQRMSMEATPEVGEAVLRKEWVTDEQMQRGLADCFRATRAFSGDGEHAQRIKAKFGNDPDFVWLMAQVGKELHEDTPVNGALSESEQASLESLMGSRAYLDAKDPQHAQTVAKVRAMYTKRYGP
jgi:hypothetical protein